MHESVKTGVLQTAVDTDQLRLRFFLDKRGIYKLNFNFTSGAERGLKRDRTLRTGLNCSSNPSDCREKGLFQPLYII
jgi:hypothetical protein